MLEVRYPLPEQIEPPEEKMYECPVCGAELCGASTLYINEFGECVGCEECIKSTEAAVHLEE